LNYNCKHSDEFTSERVTLILGQNVQCPNADEIIYTLHEREYVEKIEKAYSYASKTLLDLLMDDRALMARLR